VTPENNNREQKVFVDSILCVPVFRTEFNGLSDEMGLESILKEELKKNKIPSEDGDIEQSYPELHLKEEMRPLCDNIFRTLKCISKDILFLNPEYKIEITAMWANKQKPGTVFERHRHHNNILAGVFYVNGGESFPHISFWNPSDPHMLPTVVKFNEFNSLAHSYPTTKDALLVFPAHIDHSVAINKSGEDRYSISFNVMFRGTYDTPESLQSVTL